MSDRQHQISFPNTDRAAIFVTSNSLLSDSLTIHNSPVLFGCRTGICGTCLVAIRGDTSSPDPDEREILEIFAPNNPLARLACQIIVIGDIEILDI
ncbi:2Fe-2S iron-sulfur cluster-binding protein [Chamaesiphon sp. VAR_48_metabat_403]|uniref:2Fe-2S iron-sulfur cluster-binding protein n=1 Tax=Chamaesiphon sp. VAR_48_metabat_403 TaxID=2964700 RepID=UPI00286DA7AA|nr:2Fe-2S iron-sulfur cluster-binding protein [Chamaesiphon sp. VAR_48_metabat_403]